MKPNPPLFRDCKTNVIQCNGDEMQPAYAKPVFDAVSSKRKLMKGALTCMTASILGPSCNPAVAGVGPGTQSYNIDEAKKRGEALRWVL